MWSFQKTFLLASKSLLVLEGGRRKRHPWPSNHQERTEERKTVRKPLFPCRSSPPPQSHQTCWRKERQATQGWQ